MDDVARDESRCTRYEICDHVAYFVGLRDVEQSHVVLDSSTVGQRIPVVRHAEWGALTERRLQFPSGFEGEMGFVERSWAATDPVDSGTAEVVTGGALLPIYDPEGLLAQLARTVG